MNRYNIAKKSFNFGKHAIDSKRKVNEVVLSVELMEDEMERPIFSVCAKVWNGKHTDIVWGGQCLDRIANACPTLRSDETYGKILGLWKRNHCNDLHAGTIRQEGVIDAWIAKGNKYDYDSACKVLKDAGLYEDDGYEYGTGWIYKAISDSDLATIKELLEVA